MKKFLQYYPEFLFVALPLVLIVYGVYKSEIAPFEKIDFFNLYYNQNDITHLLITKKENPAIKLQPNTVVAENEKYILKKRSEGEFLIFDKKTKQTRLVKGVKDTDILKLVGTNYLKHKRCDQNRTLAKNGKYIVLTDICKHLKLLEKRNKQVLKSFQLNKPVLDAKFYKKYLFYYTDGIYTIDLGSLHTVDTMHRIGLNAEHAMLFPFDEGVIVYIVAKGFKSGDDYLLFYHKSGKKLELATTYRLKKPLSNAYKRNGSLYLNLEGGMTYRIYPQGEELKYELE